jgi:hypothetical protein
VEDPINEMAERIDRFVKNLRGKECSLCKKAFVKYDEQCMCYGWNVSYFSGRWHFSLYCHTDEVWYTIVSGSITKSLLVILEKLHSGEWKK